LIRIEDTTLIPAIHEEFEQVASAKGIGGLLRRHTPGLALIVSQSCNLGCSYCLAKQGTFGLPVVNMKIDDVRRRLEDFFTRQPDIDFIKFFGGEPTLRMDLIRGVCDFVTRDLGRSVHFALTTNGTLDARSHLETWQRYHMSVSVSVDGPAEIHDAVRTHKDGRGSFREAIRYCDTLSRENFPFAVVGVFDERHLSAGMSYLDTIRYLNTHSSLAKVVFVEALGDATNSELCSKPEAAHRARKQVNDAVDAIMANATEHWIKPGGPEWVYDNNLFRFLSGIVSGTAVPYEHACTASNLTTLFPSGAMMSCYTLSEKPGFGLGNART
jgi:sulfatase maturation enzyme AslB (radical SAM superfamily)